jgi:hypothetical protein
MMQQNKSVSRSATVLVLVVIGLLAVCQQGAYASSTSRRRGVHHGMSEDTELEQSTSSSYESESESVHSYDGKAHRSHHRFMEVHAGAECVKKCHKKCEEDKCHKKCKSACVKMVPKGSLESDKANKPKKPKYFWKQYVSDKFPQGARLDIGADWDQLYKPRDMTKFPLGKYYTSALMDAIFEKEHAK